MQVSCKDLERILRDADPAEWAALEAHAASCAACAEELRAWKSLSIAARELRNDWPSPALWLRIEPSLAEAQRKPRPSRLWSWLSVRSWPSLSWQTAAAAMLLVLLSTFAVRMLVRRPVVETPTGQNSPFLKDDTLREVERAEAAYEKAIERLAAEAKPQLENRATPLLANYRERLLVIDSAISDLRAVAGKNPGNAHLRRQLLALYQEKQNALEEILEEKR